MYFCLYNERFHIFLLLSSRLNSESSGGTGETREDRVARSTREMQSKMPAPYDLYEVRERLRLMGHTSSMNIFLRQEIDRMQRVGR